MHAEFFVEEANHEWKSTERLALEQDEHLRNICASQLRKKNARVFENV
jgi:hypothetical protein